MRRYHCASFAVKGLDSSLEFADSGIAQNVRFPTTGFYATTLSDHQKRARCYYAREVYLDWLRRTCESVDLLGLDLKDSQNVRLGRGYVPAVTAARAVEDNNKRAHITVATLKALADQQALPAAALSAAITGFGIDANALEPCPGATA